MNRKGAFFSLYFALFIFVLAGTVIIMYLAGQQTIQAAVISPTEVLHARDAAELYSLIEEEAITKAFTTTSKTQTFGTQTFLTTFRQELITNLQNNEYAHTIIQEDLVIDGKVRELKPEVIDTLFQNRLYATNNFAYEGETIRLQRAPLQKTKTLRAERGNANLRFPVKMSYTYQKEYLINSQGDILTEQ